MIYVQSLTLEAVFTFIVESENDLCTHWKSVYERGTLRALFVTSQIFWKLILVSNISVHECDVETWILHFSHSETWLHIDVGDILCPTDKLL